MPQTLSANTKTSVKKIETLYSLALENSFWDKNTISSLLENTNMQEVEDIMKNASGPVKKKSLRTGILKLASRKLANTCKDERDIILAARKLADYDSIFAFINAAILQAEVYPEAIFQKEISSIREQKWKNIIQDILSVDTKKSPVTSAVEIISKFAKQTKDQNFKTYDIGLFYNQNAKTSNKHKLFYGIGAQYLLQRLKPLYRASKGILPVKIHYLHIAKKKSLLEISEELSISNSKTSALLSKARASIRRMMNLAQISSIDTIAGSLTRDSFRTFTERSEEHLDTLVQKQIADKMKVFGSFRVKDLPSLSKKQLLSFGLNDIQIHTLELISLESGTAWKAK